MSKILIKNNKITEILRFPISNRVNKFKKIFIFLLVFIMLVLPVVSMAQKDDSTGIIPCDNVKVNCDFDKFIDLIVILIKFALFKMAVPIAAIMFVYAGFEMVTSAGSAEKRGMAIKVFTNTATGLIIAAASWLIIKTLLQILGYKYSYLIGF